MNLSIVIVNWNSKEYLDACIQSIVRTTRALRYEIVVIDSGSFDGCDRMLSDRFPEVRFIQSQANLGFAKANNCAYRLTTGDCILFLNPDTEVTGEAIQDLYRHLNTLPSAGAVGARLLNADGTLQSSCIQSIPTVLNQVLDSEFLRSRWPNSGLWGMSAFHGDVKAAHEVEAISGACVMVTRTAFESVHGFSEDYFMYAEDIDLAYKIRRAGYRNYYVPGAVVIHHGGSSSQQVQSTFPVVMMREAIFRFLKKTRGTTYGLAYRTGMAGTALGKLLLLVLTFPLSASTERRGAWLASLRKSFAIVRWSVNRDKFVRQYYASDARA
jgi:GT2 family glycosyltransferase